MSFKYQLQVAIEKLDHEIRKKMSRIDDLNIEIGAFSNQILNREQEVEAIEMDLHPLVKEKYQLLQELNKLNEVNKMFDFEEANKLLKEPEKITENLPAIYTEEEFSHLVIDQNQLQSCIEASKLVSVYSVADALRALSMALQARKLAKRIEEEKQAHLKERMEYQKKVSGFVKQTSEELKAIEQDLVDKIGVWIDEQSFEGYTSDLDSIKVEDGSLRRVNTWNFEIEDVDLIPRNFMQPNEKSLEAAVKGGIREIPGVKIFLSQELKLRVKNN